MQIFRTHIFTEAVIIYRIIRCDVALYRKDLIKLAGANF